MTIVVRSLPEKARWTEAHPNHVIVYHAIVAKKDKHGNEVGGKPVFVGRLLIRDRSKY